MAKFLHQRNTDTREGGRRGFSKLTMVSFFLFQIHAQKMQYKAFTVCDKFDH